jgi:2-polyprenyl-6-methoxyphenol hydroxylase-like FAD-dependent oxidoreductase
MVTMVRVVIIGGGVAGSAAAVAMRRIGADVTVYEAYRDPAGPYGSFVSLAGNGLRALDSLGVLAAVQAAGFPVERQLMWSGSGRALGDVPRGRRAGDPLQSVTLMRSDLVAALRTEAARAGARIVPGERVAADDNRCADADLVVAADGIGSSARRLVDPDAVEPAYAGLYTVSGIARPRSASPTGSFNMIFGRRGSFIHLTAPDGAVWWSAQIAAAVAPDLDTVTPATVAACFSAEPAAAGIIAATSRIDSATVNEVLAPVRRQHNGRVVLIGDAAHPVGAGQGASMALEDAVVLARVLDGCDQELGSANVAAALASFTAQRADRLGRMARSASRNREAKTAGPVAARIRDLVMPVMFNRMYERATGWLYDFDPGSLPTPGGVVDNRTIAAETP